MANKNTRQIDGFRWVLTDGTGYDGLIKAIPQQRCKDDSGRVYYRYCNPTAHFDNVADRDKFVAQWTAAQWAIRHDLVTV